MGSVEGGRHNNYNMSRKLLSSRPNKDSSTKKGKQSLTLRFSTGGAAIPAESSEPTENGCATTPGKLYAFCFVFF